MRYCDAGYFAMCIPLVGTTHQLDAWGWGIVRYSRWNYLIYASRISDIFFVLS